ncbi:hypothetical protein SPRG_01131 [Saprolegnia parasitica CBS 223.65]|uniref:FHA domain-containing protein n=1 Tax=Saprolegnia parasitica (strain CBS 223.65) TaxID=695850 RepID=A0A067D7S9_SAPPC|nr:hypothetical protein SPRG_01131 [Saprolegnia parasitica CBS 223.65]KDO35067.1 hypothetical protein SPRG_01131 [Saprolegnia parasitica CBS 223.65]|eukprot:XP_012194720.1 hypothetical protein SPRG_01131 [Saprolegnia parasitica CBS 223.65]
MSQRFPMPRWAGAPTHANVKGHVEVVKDGTVLDKVAIGQQACTVFGRNGDVCDVELAHETISRQHAAIVHTKTGSIEIMDLGSAQGTTVDGEPLRGDERRALTNGSEVRFGKSSRVYILRGLHAKDEAPAPLPVAADEIASLPTGFAKQGTTKQLSQKELERKQREEEIRKMTMDMMASAPQFTSVAVDAPAPTEAVDEKEEDDEDDDQDDDGDKKKSSLYDSGPESDSDDDEGQDDVAQRYSIPVTNEVVLSAHAKTVSCIAVDASGGRVATGSMDYHMKLWDFAGMARHVRPFRDSEVEDGHPLMALSYSPTGDRVLAVTGSAQPKVFSREGVFELQFTKGDPYLLDMVHTKGHTASCSGGMWHPLLKDTMITSGLDGAVRVWKLNGKTSFDKLLNDAVLKLKSRQGKRTEVTACAYSVDGGLIAGATTDALLDAHKPGSPDLGISSIRFSPDNKMLATRSASDDCVKLWDMRKPSTPVKTYQGIENVFSMANLAFNGVGSALVAGSSVRAGSGDRGQVHFLDVYTATTAPLRSIPMAEDESAVSVAWHAGINQVFVGGSSSNVRVLYDPALSSKGVLLSATKKLPVATAGFVRLDSLSEGRVVNPHALPMYRETTTKVTKRKYAKVRMDPIASQIPERPLTGVGVAGRTGGNTFTQYFMRDHVKSASIRSEDPREAILKYAKAAAENPTFLGSAYADSQPQDKLDARYKLAKQTFEEEKIAKEEEARRLLDI